MAQILVVFGGYHGHTHRIARQVSALVQARGYESKLLDSGIVPWDLPLAPYAAVVVGGAVHWGHHPHRLLSFIRHHRQALAHKLSAFFSVSLAAASPRPAEHRRAAGWRDRFLALGGWQPEVTALFAGALSYSRYGPVLKRGMQGMAQLKGLAGAHDLRRDHTYTDWAAVDNFAEALVARLPPAEANIRLARAAHGHW